MKATDKTDSPLKASTAGEMQVFIINSKHVIFFS